MSVLSDCCRLFLVISRPCAELVLTLAAPGAPTGAGYIGGPLMVSPDHQRLGFAVVSAILVLWDINHTLIENHGVNKETYALAFNLLTGREAEQQARTDGRTEPEIMRDMLTLH